MPRQQLCERPSPRADGKYAITFEFSDHENAMFDAATAFTGVARIDVARLALREFFRRTRGRVRSDLATPSAAEQLRRKTQAHQVKRMPTTMVFTPEEMGMFETCASASNLDRVGVLRVALREYCQHYNILPVSFPKNLRHARIGRGSFVPRG